MLCILPIFFFTITRDLQTIHVTLVGILEQNGENHHVRESLRFLVCMPNHSDAIDVFVGRPIIGMSHGLANTALALPPFISDAVGRYWWTRWIEKQPNRLL